ncbi:MAG TPA: DNA polymerase I [Candidatus Caccopulliclostridium gallistercoris]|uniref:DNA polymerase I n=1 Tax=Candidatus Caccopulliclostridium gallistercoris TaxID=2840719 RepID=A0A9D1NDY6_9FIRM|nr:DNA polymerase I [Candidatus Caccopulliclostridium gallistercoris]
MKDKFLIVDGNSLAYRAYYAMPFLTSPEGTNTGAVFGFFNMLLKAIEDNTPNYIAVAFDFSKHTFRTEIFKDYKGTRQETPPELREQFPIIKELLKKLKIAVFEMENIEADDIIGTLAKSSKTTKNLILSGDRDLLQLIDTNTEVLLTKHGTTSTKSMTLESLKEEMHITPSQVVDLKALMGDNSDNIPGVKGVGPKTAQDLIEAYGTLENVYKHIDELKGSLKEKLIKDKEMAFLSYTLAKIKTDVELDFKLENLKLHYPFDVSIKEDFKRFGFGMFLKRNIFAEVKEVEEKSQSKNIEIDSLEILENLELSNTFAFNFNGNIEFSTNSDTIYTLKKNFDLFSKSIETNDVILKLKNVLEDDSILKLTSDLKQELHLLKNLGIEVKNVFDLKLGAYLIGGSKNITTSTNTYFELYEDIKTKLKNLDLEKLYYNIELPLLYVLYDMESAGFKINSKELLELSDKYTKELSELENSIQELAGEQFNVKSPKQLASILFDKLGLKAKFFHKKNSTNIDVLNELISEHPIVPLIIRYRKIQKLHSTYIEPYIELVKNSGDIIHTVFNQTLTATGRLSSSEPNLQNIPVRDDEGKLLRKLFISRFDGGNIISADYNQIELRLLAHYSGDEKLVNAYKENKDIHTLTASQVFGVPESEVTPIQRRSAKAVNFGIIYGISDFGLSQNANLSRKEAKLYIEKYFATYPSVKEYMDSNVKFARENGYIKTIMGRIRRIPEINSNVYQTRQFGERVAMNMPLQGSASDIIKMAMIKVEDALKNLKSKLILQIHDELIVDTYPGEESTVKQILKDCMENVVALKVPLPVDINMGKTWFDCK